MLLHVPAKRVADNPIRRWLLFAGTRLRDTWARVAITATGLLLLGIFLRSEQSSIGRWLVHRSYDIAMDWSLPLSPRLDDTPVVLIYLDLQSYLLQKQNPAEPWDRALHAKLVDRLTQAGARAVVFDIVFSDPGPDPAADRAFADAMRANGNVILGAELSAASRATGQAERLQTLTLSPPLPLLLHAAASWGLAHSRIDEDFVARHHFPGYPMQGQPSLAWATTLMLNLPVTDSMEFLDDSPWIRYYGGPITLPHVSYSSALDLAGVDDGFFRGRVVFVGARPITGGFVERRDELRSPLTTWDDSELFHPGVEIHATQMLNLMREDWLTRWSHGAELLLLLFVAALVPAVLFQIRPLPATIWVCLSSIAVGAGAISSVVWLDRWYPWLIISAVQLPLALLVALVHHSLNWYRDRKELEAQRRAAEQIIREQADLIEKAQDAILVVNLDGQLTYANPSACRLYGGSLEALRTARLFSPEAADPDSPVRAAHSRTLHRGEWTGELSHHTLNGQSLVVQSRWTLVRDGQERPKAFLMINTDITEKKQLEVAFLRTQRMQTIGSLAGGMVHDLNNALAPVLMGVQLMQRRAHDDDTKRMLQIMESNTHRGADLVRQVLLFARGSGTEAEALNIHPLISEVVRLLKETFPPSITVRTLLADDLWRVRAQPTQIHQILLNLCVNARDAMPEGGVLNLAADNVDLTAAEAAALQGARPGAFVMLVVSDSGEGIPVDLQSRVFEPFFTTKPPGQGTGLGLSVVASIVQSGEGFLHLESDAENGTAIEVYLPRALVETDPPPPPHENLPPQGRGELILIVDDEQSIRTMLANALTEHGYRTLTAANTAEALTLAQENTSSLKLVLLDHLMPIQNGANLLPEIRHRCPDIATILISGQASDQFPLELPDEPSIALLPKPFPLEKLFKKIHTLLHPPTAISNTNHKDDTPLNPGEGPSHEHTQPLQQVKARANSQPDHLCRFRTNSRRIGPRRPENGEDSPAL